AIASAVGGYVLAANVPESLVRGGSVNAAGMMAVTSGALVVLAAVFSPSHGYIAKALRRRSLQKQIAVEDILATLFRCQETGQASVEQSQLDSILGVHKQMRSALSNAQAAGLVSITDARASLTDAGHEQASTLIRKHRMWEGYLVDKAGMPADHVHSVAEQLEHLRNPIPGDGDAPSGDQHGKPIPPGK
ncbi:MAG: hypothetical protein JKY96_00935, partial [Phycisphaerales bacterium]|nr:hypothetical protein [Phycisphaerales bacterium]